jgi:DNA-binding transcriptional regulator YiaG
MILISGVLFILMWSDKLRSQLRAKPKDATPPKVAARQSLAGRLRRIRFELALSPAQMAARLNISGGAQAIEDYESCTQEPSLETLALYAHVAGISLEAAQDNAHASPAPDATKT